MTISIGTQLTTPNGYCIFPKGSKFRYAGRSGNGGSVCLVEFIGPKKSAIPHFMTAAHFDSGIDGKAIMETEDRPTLPPWLSRFEGVDFEAMEASRESNGERRWAETCEKRFEIIEEVRLHQAAILSSPEPARELASHIPRSVKRGDKECGVNVTRAADWAWTLIGCAGNKWSLYPQMHACGRYEKGSSSRSKVAGPLPKKRGYVLSEADCDRAVQAFKRVARTGRTLEAVYRKVARKEFGCIKGEGENGWKRIEHPSGLPFPTYQQFRRIIHEKLGEKFVQTRLYGARLRRHKSKVVKGSYSEMLPNLLSAVEMDASHIAEIPRGLLKGAPISPMLRVYAACGTSTMIVGLGFDIEGESRLGYRLMRFCMAIDKVLFCALFGVTIEFSQWPCEGVQPPNEIMDRAQAALAAMIKDLRRAPPASEKTASNEGQDKGLVESRHEKIRHHEEGAAYVLSTLTPIRIIQKEIRRVLALNASANIEKKVSHIPDLSSRPASPIELWNYLSSRGRTCGERVTLENAVRDHLDPVKLDLREDGAYLHGRRYDSKKLQDIRMNSKAYKVGGTAEGFVVPFAVRFLFTVINDRMEILEVKLGIAASNDEKYLSLDEIRRESEISKKRMFASAEHRRASYLEQEAYFEMETGEDWDSEVLKHGRLKDSAESLLETAETKRVLLGGAK